MLPNIFSNGVASDANAVNANFAILSYSGLVQYIIDTVAPTGWLLLNGYTIGDGSSGGTARANIDCYTLFCQIWNKTVIAQCPIYDSTGAVVAKGATADLDWNAHKRLSVPNALGKSIFMYDSGQTEFNALALVGGAKTVTLTSAMIPSHTHNITTGTESADHVHYDSGHTETVTGNLSQYYHIKSGIDGTWGWAGSGNVTINTGTGYAALGGRSAAHTHSGTTDGGTGGAGAHANLPPYLVLSAIIKI